MAIYREYLIQRSIEEVTSRLASAIGPDNLFDRLEVPEGAIVGKFDVSGFRLRVRGGYGNPFAPIAYGRLQPHEMGVRMILRYSYHRLTTGFLILVYGVCALSLLFDPLGVSSALRWAGSGPAWAHSLAAAFLMFAIATGCTYASSEDREKISEFVERVFSDSMSRA